MTSTNDGKDVKIVETSGVKGKIYYIELYKNLECRLTEEQELPARTGCLKAAWQQIHTLCLHSAPNTHPHLLSWLQRHTAKTILQTEWQSPKSKYIHTILEDGINSFIAESESAVATRNGRCLPWEAQLLQRAAWFKTMLGNPWGHPVLRMLLDPRGSKPSDDEVLEWLKEERGVLFVTRLRQLAASKCDDLALTLSGSVMDRVRACTILVPDNEQTTAQEEQRSGEPTFKDILTKDAGFTVDVWEVLTDMEFVLLHKSDKRAQCIDLAKQTPLRDGYQLVERLQSRLETSPKEKKLWKNAKEVATLIAQVIIARCMVTDSCIGVARTALYCCARSLARLVPANKLPAAAAALAAPAHTARHVHTFASAARAQLHTDTSRSAFVCELYVRAITAGMNELERLKLKTEKETEARSHEQTLAAWFCQLGNLLHTSDRIKCECLLTAFSMHPAPDMYERIQALPKVQKYKEQAQDHQETTSEFGSWASDSRSQTNLVKTSETLNMKQTQSRNNVLSVAMLNEGERVGLGPELCQDLAVLLSGPRLKTLSWDMDREELLKNCQAYMERTSGGTRTLTTELKFLNLDPNKYQHLPEEADNVDDVYYGIEKGYEHLVEFQDPEPEEIWQDAIFSQTESSEESDSSHNTIASKSKRKAKKKSKRIAKVSSESETDPLSLADIKEVKKTETQKEKKKERPHSKERRSDKKKPQSKVKNQDRALGKEKKEPKQRKCNAGRSQSKEKRKDSSQSKERKKEKRKEKKSSEKQEILSIRNNNELSKLIGKTVSNEPIKRNQFPSTTSIKQPPLSRQTSDLQNYINVNIKSPLPEPSPSPSYNPTGFNQAFLAHIQKTVSPTIFNKPTNSSNSSPVPQRKVKTMQTKVRNIVGQLQQNTRPASPMIKNQSNANAVPSLPSPKAEAQVPTDTTNKHKELTISDEVKKSITRLIKFRKPKTDCTSPGQTASNSSASASDGASSFNSLNPLVKTEERIQCLRDQMSFLLNFNSKSHGQVSHKNTNTQHAISDSHPDSSNMSSPSAVTIQSKTNLNAFLNQQIIKYHSKNRTQQQIKKDMRAQAQFTELFKNVQRNLIETQADPTQKVIPRTATSNTSQTSQSPKHASHTKKVDNAPNTFARLSYLHKNKQEQAKMNVLEAAPSTSTPINDHSTAQLDKLISGHHNLKAYHNSKAHNTSRVENERIKKSISKIRTYRKSNDKVNKKVFPNKLQDNQMCSSNTEKVSQPLKLTEEKQNKQIPKASSSNNLTMQDQAELLLLLHQQNVLNSVSRSYPDTSGSTHLSSQKSNANAVQPNVQSTLRTNPTHVTGSIHLQGEQKKPIAPNQSIVQKCPKETVQSITFPIKNKEKSQRKVLPEPIPVVNFPVRETPIIRSMLNSPNVIEKKGHRKSTVEAKKEKPVIKQITQAKENSEIPSSYSSKQNEKADWESVMNLLLAQKTPKRGPNALDMTLNKGVNKQNEEPKVVKTETTSPQVPVMTDIAQSHVTKSTCASSVSQNNEVLPITPVFTKKIEQKPVKVEPKLINNKAAPSLSKHLSKDDDPFMSGIPNSDYDLLEELMDDELRQEIGELSSDEDTFTSRTSLNRNVIKSKDQKFVSKQCKVSSVERKSITTPVLCTQQSEDKKHIVDNTQIIKTGHVQTPSMSAPFTKTKKAIHSSPNVNVAFVKPQEKPETPKNVSIISPVVANIPGPVNAANYIITQQQPQVQNMFLIGADIVYDPFTSVQIQNTNIASNSILAVNSAPIAFHRTTQVVAPVVNTVLVQNCMTLQQENSPIQSNLVTTENPANIHNRNNSIDSITIRNKATRSLSSQTLKHSETKTETFQKNNKAECKPKNTAHNVDPNQPVQSQSIIKKQKDSQSKLLAKRIQADSLRLFEGLGEKSNLLQMTQSQAVQQTLANHSKEKKESKKTTSRRRTHSKIQNIEKQQNTANLCEKRHESNLNTTQSDSKIHHLEKALKSQSETVQKTVTSLGQDKHEPSQSMSKNKIRSKKQYSEYLQESLNQTEQITMGNLSQGKQRDQTCKIQNVEKQSKSFDHTDHVANLNTTQSDSKIHLEKALKSQSETVQKAVTSLGQDKHEPSQATSKNKIRSKKQCSEYLQKPLNETEQLSMGNLSQGKQRVNQTCKIQNVEKQSKSSDHTVKQMVANPSQDKHEPNQTSTKSNLQNPEKQHIHGILIQNFQVSKKLSMNKNKKRLKKRQDDIDHYPPSQNKKIEPEFQRRTRSFSVPAKNEPSPSVNVTEGQSKLAGIRNSLNIQKNEDSNSPIPYQDKNVDDRSIKLTHSLINIDQKKTQHNKLRDQLESTEVKNKIFMPEVTKLIDVKSNLDNILQKQLERKVLSEVQEKLSSSAEIMETKLTDTKNLERIKEKRAAIIHRQITHYSYYPSIPLTYSPITIVKEPPTPHTIDSFNGSLNQEHSLSIETKDETNNENKEGIEYALTPDSQDDVENKSTEIAADDNSDSKPQCRRILLRSSNKHIDFEKSTTELKHKKYKKVKSDIKFDSKADTSSITMNRRSKPSKRASVRIQAKVATDRGETIVDSVRENINNSLDDAQCERSLTDKSVRGISNCTRDLLQNALTNVEECSQNNSQEVLAQSKPCLILSDEPSRNSGYINNVTYKQATASEQTLVEKELKKNLLDDVNSLKADSIMSKDKSQKSAIVKSVISSESVNNRTMGTKKYYNKDYSSGNMSKDSAVNTPCQDKVAKRKDSINVSAKERMCTDVIEKYRNFILIKEIPSSDPNVRCARIQLPNKKAFKVTITGGKSISYDSILENPQIRDYLLNSINEDTRHYTINIQKTVTTNPVSTTTLQSSVNKMETIDLLSDEDESNSKKMYTFKTEYGSYSVRNIDDEIYDKHQSKFMQKCSITLHDCHPKEQIITAPIINCPTSEQILNYEEIVLSSDTDTDFVTNTQSKQTTFMNKDVIEIDDSSNDEDLRQFILPIEIKNTLSGLKNLKDLNVTKLRKRPETRNPEYNNKVTEPKVGNIVELKNKLLQDLDINPLDLINERPCDINISTDFNASSKTTTSRSDITTFKIKHSDESKQICPEIIIRQCFVKLVRCDEHTEKHEIHEKDQDPPNTELLLSFSDTEDASSAVSSRRGSFSILNEFPISLTDSVADELNHCLPQNICNVLDPGKSSPVMEIYELLSNFVSSKQVERLNQTVLPLICDSDYFATKPHYSLFHKQQPTYKYFCDETNQCFLRYTKVPSLISLVTHYLNNSERVKYASKLPSNLKRKLIAKPSYAFTMKRSRKGLAPGSSNKQVFKELDNNCGQCNLTHIDSSKNSSCVDITNVETFDKAIEFFPTLREDQHHKLNYPTLFDTTSTKNLHDQKLKTAFFKDNSRVEDPDESEKQLNKTFNESITKNEEGSTNNLIKSEYSQSYDKDTNTSQNNLHNENDLILTFKTEIVSKSCGTEDLQNSDKCNALDPKMQESCVNCKHELLESNMKTEIKQLSDCKSTYYDTSIIRNTPNCEQSSIFDKDNNTVLTLINKQTNNDMTKETNTADSSTRHIFSNDNIALEVTFVDEHSDDVIIDNYKPVKTLKELAKYVLDQNSNDLKLDVTFEADKSNSSTSDIHNIVRLETIKNDSNQTNLSKEFGQEVYQNRKSIEFEITFEDDYLNVSVIDDLIPDNEESFHESDSSAARESKTLAENVLNHNRNKNELEVTLQYDNSNATSRSFDDAKSTNDNESQKSEKNKELNKGILNHNNTNIEIEVTFEDDNSDVCKSIHAEPEIVGSIKEIYSNRVECLKELAQKVLDQNSLKSNQSSSSKQSYDKSAEDLKKYNYTQIINCLKSITSSHLESSRGKPQQKMAIIYKDSDVILNGVLHEDPEIGTCYLFPYIENENNSIDAEVLKATRDGLFEVVQEIEMDDDIEDGDIAEETLDTDLQVLIPKNTYTNRSVGSSSEFEQKRRKPLKRKLEMCRTKTTKTKYRKGKNIDYPKIRATSTSEFAYEKEFKRLLDYITSVEFSYDFSFHKDYPNDNLHVNWPIKGMCETQDNALETIGCIFDDNDSSEVVDPLHVSLMDEINVKYDENEHQSCNETEIHLNMGFGEGSGRVLHNSENGGSLHKFSAATLSDVKHSQPFLLFEDYEDVDCLKITSSKQDHLEKVKQYIKYIQLREKVRTFFRNTTFELNEVQKYMRNDKENNSNKEQDMKCSLISELCKPDFIKPLPMETLVNVVQVGQLPVSTAAQNPVTCDPRVTQVSDASPSQCSVENSPRDDSQSGMKTEYTELTTADLSMPLMQTYSQHSQEPEDSTSLLPPENTPIKAEIKEEDIDTSANSSDMSELLDLSKKMKKDDTKTLENDISQDLCPNQINNIDYSFDVNNTLDADADVQMLFKSTEKESTEALTDNKNVNGASDKTDQLAHAMNAAGITTTPESVSNNRAHALVNLLSQKIRQSNASAGQASANNFTKTASINAMSLQQALAQILPPALNQVSENIQTNQNTSVGPQVLHFVQSKNGSGNQITLLDNSQQSVINNPNSTSVLHIVQNKTSSPGVSNSGGTNVQQTNSYSGLSLVDAGIQQGGNQLLHIVNTGNQKNGNTGQVIKRVNLLTNLANVQGSNEQKMVQFVCKSADGKPLQLNGPHQRSMVLRLQPIETPAVQNAPQSKPTEAQDHSPSVNVASSSPGNDSNSQQEIKSRSIYEENYAKFIQNSSTKPSTGSEKSTSLPKFNQAFGKPVFQDGNQKPEDLNTNTNSLPSLSNNNTETNNASASEGSINMDQINQMNTPPSILQQKPTVQTSQPQPNLVQQIKQTLGPMNIQTMHGGVIYTRQIPVNIGGGQTINLITVPSTELIDDPNQKNHNEMEPSIIKIVPQTGEGQSDDLNNQARSGENAQNMQPQPVLTQMRIKLPMLSKAPHMVSGTRVVRPSFFQIQRNVIGGANQPVYQQLVLTTAPPLGQQTIRLPTQTQTRPTKLPSESQSSSESQMSSSTLEQLREFDMVLEQVKERSTVQPNGNSTNSFSGKIHTSSTDTTDGSGSVTSNTTDTHSVLYSIGVNQTANVAYLTRKAPVSTPTTSTFVRSPDSSGIADSPSSTLTQMSHGNSIHNETSNEASQHKSSKVSSKSKSRPKTSSNPPTAMKINNVPPKPSTQKPLEDEQTTQRILYILAEYKEQVENSPDKDKPAPRRRSNPPANPPGSSKRKKSSSGSRRSGGRDMSPVHGDETCRTMGSEDSSCGTSQGDCTENCLDSHSPQDSPRKVARKLTFDQDNATPATTPQPQPPQPQRNVIVADGQTITVARGTAGKPATAVLMPANYILPVSMVKGGQQIAIVTNRGPKLLTVGAAEAGTTNALLLQRLIGPAGLKPVLARPGVRHVRLPTAALHNLQAFNLAASATTVQPPDSTASSATASQDVTENRIPNSPWTETQDSKLERGSSPDGSEPWHLPSSADNNEYNYEDVRADHLDRTVLDAIPDRYSPDMEAQRIFDKMFDTDSKKSYIVDSHDDSPRCGYDIDASDDDKAYQVVHKKYGTQQHRRLTHVSAAALRHKYAILEQELRLQKSLSEECEDLGVDSPSASELFPEAELLFAASPAQDHGSEGVHRSHSPPPPQLTIIPQPDIDDQIATDQLLQRDHLDDRTDLDVNLGLDVDAEIQTPLDHEEFARSHPNTTFHSEPTDDEVVQPFTITELKARHITSAIFHANRAPTTVLMTAPQTTVISQATADGAPLQNPVKYSDIDNMINSLPGPHTNTINLSSVLVKDDGLTRFDSILTDSRELHLTNTASAIVHATGNATQVIRRVCYDEKRAREHFLMDEPGVLIGEDAKMVGEDNSRDAPLGSMVDVDDDRSSPERHTELFWESNSASERSESRRPLDFSSDSDKCCKSPSLDETNSTDSSGVGTHMRLDSVIKEARGVERSCSAEGSSADDTHPPLRTYPAAKRMYHTESDVERSLSGKTREGERSPDSLEVRRRASGRGVVKRGCHCCNGSPAPSRPKKSRPRKPNMEFH